jgi:hypothetical protein
LNRFLVFRVFEENDGDRAGQLASPLVLLVWSLKISKGQKVNATMNYLGGNFSEKIGLMTYVMIIFSAY